MQDTQNIQIPFTLFKKLLFFFNCVNFGDYKFPAFYDFNGIYAGLLAKQDKINLRTAYTNTILAKDDGQKIQAYANYQKLKYKK